VDQNQAITAGISGMREPILVFHDNVEGLGRANCSEQWPFLKRTPLGYAEEVRVR
jgi:hypothetical protein